MYWYLQISIARPPQSHATIPNAIYALIRIQITNICFKRFHVENAIAAAAAMATTQHQLIATHSIFNGNNANERKKKM